MRDEDRWTATPAVGRGARMPSPLHALLDVSNMPTMRGGSQHALDNISSLEASLCTVRSHVILSFSARLFLKNLFDLFTNSILQNHRLLSYKVSTLLPETLIDLFIDLILRIHLIHAVHSLRLCFPDENIAAALRGT